MMGGVERVEFRVLGAFEVRAGGRVIAHGGGRRRALLAGLVAHPNQSVAASRLIELVWGEDRPSTAENLIQGYVSYWRTQLEPLRGRRQEGTRLLSDGLGYRLRVRDDECDLTRFRREVALAKRAMTDGDDDTGAHRLTAALAEHSGPALAEFPTTAMAAAATRVDDEWVAACALAAALALRRDRPADALATLQVPTAEHPLREDLAELKIAALYRLGRQGEALQAYDDVRCLLAEELGVDPGASLRQLHLDIVRQDPALDPGRWSVRAGPVPRWPTPLVGRKRLLAHVGERLAEHRLVTLTGPGGSGKTRLGTAVAEAVEERGGRAAFVDLVPVRAREQVLPAVADALEVSPAAASGGWAGLLAGCPIDLLVLDNLEQIPGIGQVVDNLTRSHQRLGVLTTSRRSLGVPGELVVDVPPLSNPEADATIDQVKASPSVQLFVERALQSTPGLSWGDADLAVVAGICRRLDGLPLALELAASWTGVLSLPGLLERLDHSLPLLVDRRGGRPDRHQSLRRTVEGSLAGLGPVEGELMDVLAVSASGEDLESLEAAVAAPGEPVVLHAISTLIDRHLVVRRGTAHPRYQLLQIVREFVVERIGARDTGWTLADLRDAHAARVMGRAATASRLCRSPTGPQITQRLHDDRDEIRGALEHLAASGRAADALALAVDALPLWWDVGNVREGVAQLQRLLAVVDQGLLPSDLVAAAHLALRILAEASGRPAIAAAHASAAGSRTGGPCATGHLAVLARGMRGHSYCWAHWADDVGPGLELLSEAFSAARALPDGEYRWGWAGRGPVLSTLALSMADVLRYRDTAGASAVVQDLLAEGIELGSLESFVVRELGALAADVGQWVAAEDHLHESLRLARGTASPRSETRSLEELARLEYARDDLPEALRLAHDASAIARRQGHALNLARCAALETDIALALGNTVTAGEILGEVEHLLRPEYPALAARTVAPRYARRARLRGDRATASEQLRRAGALDAAVPLTPDRIGYLVERCLADRATGDTRGERWAIETLLSAAAEVGLRLPIPEVRILEGPVS